MMNFSLINIFLYDWLGYDLLSRSLNSLYSILNVVFGWFSDWILFNSLVLLSVKFNFNILSLNNRLNVGLIDDLSSWSSNILCSRGLSDLCLSSDWFSIDNLSLRRNKVDFLGVINYSSFEDWLSEDFFGWCLEISVNGLIIEFGWSCYNRIINSSGLSSLNIESFSYSLYSWLDVLFSDSNITWNLNRNTSLDSSFINNWFFGLSFSVDWSRNDLLSNNWSLNNSLSDDRLGNDSLSNDWLLDDFSGNYWFRYDLLGLSDDWFRVQYLSSQVLALYSLSGGCHSSGNHFSLRNHLSRSSSF